MALLFSYISLKSSSKLPFKMSAWSNDEEHRVKDLNGISPEVQRNQLICSQICQLAWARLGFPAFAHVLVPEPKLC